ncbi:MAG: isoleucine--tRNA ligase [Candidatus Xiphinematobacter sp.]|nr:MAG: isoleucine--tRNA ligase [Candidatus Xiphinematobacter sp.]
MNTNTYRQSLNLPKTDFPMRGNLPIQEPKILAHWQKQDLYQQLQKVHRNQPLFLLHDGPPFANGDVHVGTALNKILKDFVVRSKSMAGYRAPFRPGWDCHGLPIEFKVARQFSHLSPVEIRKKSEEHARRFIRIQREQFMRLGVLGDWKNPYLTLDPSYEADVVRCFARFVQEGLVYRTRKPVLWSTGAQTALAEAEVEYKEKVSPAIYVKFPISTEEALRKALPTSRPISLVVWTTTPWTLPANLAIAVHNEFEYEVVSTGTEFLIIAHQLVANFQENIGVAIERGIRQYLGNQLVGTRAQHPFLDRNSVVYAAEFVTLKAGVGCVHVAPGHGEDDYSLGLQHGLGLLSPVDDYGRYTSDCGLPLLVGEYVLDADEKIISILKRKGALVGRSDYVHSYPHCWRSKTPLIFRAVEQFFIRIEDLRRRALEEVERVNWLPHWGKNRLRGTMESRQDWCISRQRVWGIPLPVFYTTTGDPILDPDLINRVAEIFSREGSDSWFRKSDAEWADLLGLCQITRRNDTLDVWIESGVSHEAVLRHTSGLTFPADLYLEATDQHRGWFQSSLMTSIALNRIAPYNAVLTHGFVVSRDGLEKISKSGQESYKMPTKVQHFVEKFGADVVRLWISSVRFTDDIPFSGEVFARLTDSYRRIRNTLRILLGNLDGFSSATHQPVLSTLVDKWLLARLRQVSDFCLEAYSRLEFYRVYSAINRFCTIDLSSLYIDITKDRLYCDALCSERRRTAQWVMYNVFDALCRLMAPILVFTTEEAWGHLHPGESVHLQHFPRGTHNVGEREIMHKFSQLLEVRSKVGIAIETARKSNVIGTPLQARVLIRTTNQQTIACFQERPEEIEEVLILSDLAILQDSVDSISIVPTSYRKCARCWRHRREVGEMPTHDLCGRCYDVLQRMEKSHDNSPFCDFLST